MANELGLSHSQMIALKQEVVFQIDRERWLFGYLPVNNYQATVTIYELQIKQSPSEENNCASDCSREKPILGFDQPAGAGSTIVG
jgi:hypothetical protein